ncbi:MAG: HEAT repeat domain-containing protein [Rouxiella badensis]|uniref:HEAT repeat domain-containing protein n=1 Tax=Rouxiella badensis TaxID=1646377 RepID=UPI003C4147C7
MFADVQQRLLDATNDLSNDIKLAAIYALGEGGYDNPQVQARLLVLSANLHLDIRIAALKALGRASIKRT